MVKADEPAAVGVHDTDCASLDSDKMPSFFLYDADPLGAMVGKAKKSRGPGAMEFRSKWMTREAEN
jgi:hypothetical protein